MPELLRTNDVVVLSFVEALLRDAHVEAVVLDRNMSALEGSIGILPRRVLVAEENILKARRLLEDAGLGVWLAQQDAAP